MTHESKTNQENQVCTIPEFCAQYHITRATFYRWQEQGLTPRTMKIGRRVYITNDSIKEWQLERMNEQNIEVAG